MSWEQCRDLNSVCRNLWFLASTEAWSYPEGTADTGGRLYTTHFCRNSLLIVSAQNSCCNDFWETDNKCDSQQHLGDQIYPEKEPFRGQIKNYVWGPHFHLITFATLGHRCFIKAVMAKRHLLTKCHLGLPSKSRNQLTTNAITLLVGDSQRKQLRRNCMVFQIAMVILLTRSTFLDKIWWEIFQKIRKNKEDGSIPGTLKEHGRWGKNTCMSIHALRYLEISFLAPGQLLHNA